MLKAKNVITKLKIPQISQIAGQLSLKTKTVARKTGISTAKWPKSIKRRRVETEGICPPKFKTYHKTIAVKPA